MSEHKLIYKNADGVRRTLITDDDAPNRIVVHTEQELREILPGIERDRENHRERSINKLLARIPVTIYERAVIEGWDEADWKKWLNSSEAAPFRIWRGTV
jgi:hypothetical protein